MTTPLHAIVPAAFLNFSANFIAANGTAAKVVVDPQPAAAAGALSPLYMGGGTVIDKVGVSSDTVAKDVIMWQGTALTTVGGATGTAASTTSTLTRTTGSFITDGWSVGDLVMAFAPIGTAPNAAVDGILGTITAVTATTITVNGTPFAALTLATGTRLCRMMQALRAPIPAGSGTNGTAPSVNLLNNALDGSVLRYERKLGPNELLAASMASAVSALPAFVNISVQFARY